MNWWFHELGGEGCKHRSAHIFQQELYEHIPHQDKNAILAVSSDSRELNLSKSQDNPLQQHDDIDKAVWGSLFNGKQCMDLWHPDMSSAKALENQTPTSIAKKVMQRATPAPKKNTTKRFENPKTWAYTKKWFMFFTESVQMKKNKLFQMVFRQKNKALVFCIRTTFWINCFVMCCIGSGFGFKASWKSPICTNQN